MKLIQLYFDGVFCGWADPKYRAFFRVQGYDIYAWDGKVQGSQVQRFRFKG